ncbi:MAG: hypothetical protein ACRC2R_14495, partial [Xenococcaceae cyanobacterium]
MKAKRPYSKNPKGKSRRPFKQEDRNQTLSAPRLKVQSNRPLTKKPQVITVTTEKTEETEENDFVYGRHPVLAVLESKRQINRVWI